LTRDVDKRLGSGAEGGKNVKNHPFFRDIDWEKLEKRDVEPPWKPKVKSDTDTSQIDTVFTGERPQDSLVEGTLSDAVAKENNFDGFTFVAPSGMEGGIAT
jgi:serum/glucocorticoid-regulated kinase 2